jgi:Pyruvate formate lyase-like
VTLDCCETLSPHEQRVRERIEGKEDRFRRTHARAFAILDSFEGATPIIDVERALYFTESFRQTEGQPLVLRWAKALLHIAKNITVRIDDHQLLAGRVGKPGRYGILYPELDGGKFSSARHLRANSCRSHGQRHRGRYWRHPRRSRPLAAPQIRAPTLSPARGAEISLARPALPDGRGGAGGGAAGRTARTGHAAPAGRLISATASDRE